MTIASAWFSALLSWKWVYIRTEGRKSLQNFNARFVDFHFRDIKKESLEYNIDGPFPWLSSTLYLMIQINFRSVDIQKLKPL